MICESCKKEENLEDESKDVVFVGVCGGCGKVCLCTDCIDAHIEICVEFQMILKEQAILQ